MFSEMEANEMLANLVDEYLFESEENEAEQEKGND